MEYWIQKTKGGHLRAYKGPYNETAGLIHVIEASYAKALEDKIAALEAALKSQYNDQRHAFNEQKKVIGELRAELELNNTKVNELFKLSDESTKALAFEIGILREQNIKLKELAARYIDLSAEWSRKHTLLEQSLNTQTQAAAVLLESSEKLVLECDKFNSTVLRFWSDDLKLKIAAYKKVARE